MAWGTYVAIGATVILGVLQIQGLSSWITYCAVTTGACLAAWGIANHPRVSPYWAKNIKINVEDAWRVVNYSDDSEHIQMETVLVEIENLADYELSNVCLEIINIKPFQENLRRLGLRKGITLAPQGKDRSKNRSHVAHLRDGQILLSQLIDTGEQQIVENADRT